MQIGPWSVESGGRVMPFTSSSNCSSSSSDTEHSGEMDVKNPPGATDNPPGGGGVVGVMETEGSSNSTDTPPPPSSPDPPTNTTHTHTNNTNTNKDDTNTNTDETNTTHTHTNNTNTQSHTNNSPSTHTINNNTNNTSPCTHTNDDNNDSTKTHTSSGLTHKNSHHSSLTHKNGSSHNHTNGDSHTPAFSGEIIAVELDQNEANSKPSHQGDNNTVKVNARSQSWLSSISQWIIQEMEDTFEAYGRKVATHPILAITFCITLTLLCAIGSLRFSTELRPYRLWIPQDSEFIRVLDWQVKNFPSSYRQHIVVWEADNILTARAVQEMWRLHKRVSDFSLDNDKISWERVCARVPSLPRHKEPDISDYDDFDFGSLRRRRETPSPNNDDLSLALPRDLYCNNLASLPKLCLETSLLEVWGYDDEVIWGLSDDKVLQDVNTALLSEVYGYKVNFTNYLGSIKFDEAGQITSAGAATHLWVSQIDQNVVDQGDYEVDQGNGQMVDSAGFAWEKAWVDIVLNDTSRSKDVHAFAKAASSFGNVSDGNILGDVKWLMVGIILMSIFVNLTLGRRNLVEQRPLLAIMGMLSVTQAVAISYGVCSVMGVPFCPINSILPMLLMGLGVDDMFVIISMWESAGPGDRIERAGRTMRHAGVAITVTSLTDVTAFAVGASTDLPALRSFCLYAAVGILAVYLMQATFFMAWLVMDEKRLEENRNGLVWFVKHQDWTPSSCSQVDLMKTFFKKWFTPFILSTPVRVIVIFGTGCLVTTSIWATMQLKQEFNPMWFIPSSSYLYKTFQVFTKHFPEAGESGYIYFANVTLPDDLPKLYNFTHNLIDSRVVVSVDAWFTAFQEYMTLMPEAKNSTLTNSLLHDILSVFLQSSSGALYRTDVTVNGQLECHQPAPPITSFRIGITHRPVNTPADQAAALNTIKSLVSSVPIQGYKAAWAQAYSIWETNEIVGYELWRNVVLAWIVVGLVTLILLASFSAAMLVLMCVTATVIGVSGTMWFWGLTIDTVSCIALVLAIGLSVDYAAHIAHGFLAARGTSSKKERAKIALQGAGSAVLQGGLSTLLSFLLLAGSSSHVFITFFKVFTSASILGLYYGLVFLPVMLSLIGPEAYSVVNGDEKLMVTTANHSSHSHHTHINQAFTPDQEPSKLS
ncbi:hypothetical protein Pmani_015553 [Petrolisthes manimaculis]|uniref:SSD domain-containing protein n=1 Tax=Petrolisthes manimaculis TaxID=1843537 RepID=A0AAE1PS13_9EUCA|nr:hypothetical protein Pmani_015553 [Petrolisthes manimaculis]